MGALTSNRRKRSDEYTTTLIPKFPSLYSPNFHNRIDTHISKKPKTTPMDKPSPDRPISRLNMYPEPVNQIRRQVHAPCRVSKFGFRSSLNVGNGFVQEEDLADVKGKVLSLQYDEAKDCAIRALRYLNLKKDKEVIEIVDIAESDKDDDVSPNSSIEVVEDRREGKVLEGDFGPSSSSVNVDLRVENAGKMLDSLSLNKGLDVLELPVHKKLFEEAERRNSKLNSLKYYIELNTTHLAALHSLRPVKKPEEEDVLEDVLQEPFVALTKEEEAEVSRAFSNLNRRKVLVTHENSNIEITGEVLQCLRPGAWLNDEVINLYFELLKEREKREPKFFLKCHFFNTFFFKKLISGRTGYDFKSVRRWTTQKKLGYCLLECDKIFVPIHKEIHWCLAVINKKDEKFQYLDSLGGFDTQVLKVLARYFMDEVKDKSAEQIDLSSWKQEYVEDLPQQENGWDCGMFMIKYADFYSRGLGLCFNQEHMPYFRLRTAKEILRLKAE